MFYNAPWTIALLAECGYTRPNTKSTEQLQFGSRLFTQQLIAQRSYVCECLWETCSESSMGWVRTSLREGISRIRRHRNMPWQVSRSPCRIGIKSHFPAEGLPLLSLIKCDAFRCQLSDSTLPRKHRDANFPAKFLALIPSIITVRSIDLNSVQDRSMRWAVY